MIGSSVVPGLPNMRRTPSSFITARKALRPAMALRLGLSGTLEYS